VRILMFGMSSYPGGIENYIANYFLCEEFSKDIVIDFVTYEDKLAYQDEIKKYGHNVIRVPNLKKNPFGYARAVNKLLKEKRYDCVYVNMLSAANILPIMYASKFHVLKIVAHAHASSTVKGIVRRFLHGINKRYCQKKVTMRFACSQEAGEWLFDNQTYDVIPNAIDPMRFAFSKNSREEVRQSYNIASDEFVLGHVGRFGQEKNHTFLIDVFAAYQKKIGNARLMLVGDGVCRNEIKEKVKLLGIEDKVSFVGTTNETEKYYSAFDCFVFPSIFEGFGMAALEAQASGLRCFCSKTLSPELNVTGKVDFLDLSDGAEVWVNYIETKMLENVNRSKKVVLGNFDIEQQRKNMVEILK